MFTKNKISDPSRCAVVVPKGTPIQFRKSERDPENNSIIWVQCSFQHKKGVFHIWLEKGEIKYTEAVTA